MISYKQIQELAKMRLRDSKILYKNGGYHSAIYICGYANELALKAMLCKRLNLQGIPNLSSEFNDIQKIKTHNVEELMKLLKKFDPEIEKEIIMKKQADWNLILDWHPEKRYLPIDEKSSKQWKVEADELIKSTTRVLRYFWTKL